MHVATDPARSGEPRYDGMHDDYDNRKDHDKLIAMVGDVLEEIKNMRMDMRRVVDTHSDKIEKMLDTLNEEKRRVDEALRTTEGTKKLMWSVLGVVCTVAGLSIGKAMGLL